MQACKSSSARCSSDPFQWRATVSGRFHCDACGKRQTTSWRNVNYVISQFRCEVWFTLGKQEIPARPNSVDVRVGDKLKVVQFHPVIRNNSTPSPKIINFGWHQLGVLWIRNTSLSDVRFPWKIRKPGQRTSGWRQSRCSLSSHCVTSHSLTVREGDLYKSQQKTEDLAADRSRCAAFHQLHVSTTDVHVCWFSSNRQELPVTFRTRAEKSYLSDLLPDIYVAHSRIQLQRRTWKEPS